MSFPEVPFPVAPPRVDSDPARGLRQIAQWAYNRFQEIARIFSSPRFRPVEVVDELPPPGQKGRVAILTTDNKIYRDTGTEWTASVPTVDLSGVIETHQIGDGAVTTVKLGNFSVTSEKLEDQAVTTAKLRDLSVTTTKIGDNAITKIKFAPGLEPIEVVDELPPPGNPGRVVILTSDYKLYRDTGTEWTSAVPTSDLEGQIDGSQIIDFAITERKMKLSTHMIY